LASAVNLRGDYSAAELRRLAAATKNANQSRRLLSLAAVLDGMNRTDAARIGGMDPPTLRDWEHRFTVHGLARWRRIDLQRVILERFGVTYHERTVGKLLKALGFSHISARPRHPAQDARTIETFNKRPRHSERSSRRHRRQ